MPKWGGGGFRVRVRVRVRGGGQRKSRKGGALKGPTIACFHMTSLKFKLQNYLSS